MEDFCQFTRLGELSYLLQLGFHTSLEFLSLFDVPFRENSTGLARQVSSSKINLLKIFSSKITLCDIEIYWTGFRRPSVFSTVGSSWS